MIKTCQNEWLVEAGLNMVILRPYRVRLKWGKIVQYIYRLQSPMSLPIFTWVELNAILLIQIILLIDALAVLFNIFGIFEDICYLHTIDYVLYI